MKLRGPQLSREDTWSAKNAVARSALVDKSTNENEENLLKIENISLHDQIQRILRELKRYQINHPTLLTEHQELEEGQTDWTTSFELVNPLFLEYDFRISDLQNLLQKQEVQIVSLKERCESLVTENNELRDNHMGRCETSFNTSGVHNTELLAELQQKINLLMSENGLLVEQKLSLSSELDLCVEESTGRMRELTLCNSKLSKSSQEVTTLRAQLSKMESDRDDAAAQALNCSDALGRAEIEIETVSSQLNASKQRIEQLENTVLELRSQVKELVLKGDQNGLSSFQRVKAVESRMRDLQNQLQSKTASLDAVNEINRKLRSEYLSTRHDAEGMLQVMSGLERQLNDYSGREAEVEALGRDSKEKIEEAYALKEQCLLREEQFRREIERLKMERKELAVRQTNELEKGVEQSRKLLSDQIAEMRIEIDELCERNSKLLCESEASQKDCRTWKDRLDKEQRLLEEERKSSRVAAKLLVDKLDALSVVKEQEASKRFDITEQNKTLRLTIDKLRSEIESNNRLHEQSLKQVEVDCSALKVSVRALQKELADKVRSLTRKSKEHDDLKQSLTAQVAALEARYLDDSLMYKRRAAEAEKVCKDLESVGVSGDLNTRMLVDQLKEKYMAAVNQLEWRLRQEVDSSNALALKCRNFELIVGDLIANKSGLETSLDHLHSAMSWKDEELYKYKQSVAELAGHLSAPIIQ